MCNIQRLSTRRSNNTEGKQGVAFRSCGREANSSCSDVRARRQETADCTGLPIKKILIIIIVNRLRMILPFWTQILLDQGRLGLGEGDAAAKAR